MRLTEDSHKQGSSHFDKELFARDSVEFVLVGKQGYLPEWEI